MPVPRHRFFQVTASGLEVLAGGYLTFKVAGTSTPANVYADVDGLVSLGSTVTLDAEGEAVAIYLAPHGYKVTLFDEDDVQQWSQDNVHNLEALIARLGLIFVAGSKGVTDGYTVAATDYLVTVEEPTVDPATIALQPSADRLQDITIKNVGPTLVDVTPDGAETIENLGPGVAYRLPAASSPNFPSITLRPDGVSNYWIVSSHGL